MNHQKKLKLILSSLKQKQLLRFFQLFLHTYNIKLYKSIKQISFSCYQSTCQVENLMVNGYGKSSNEALLSGINNLLDCLLQQDNYCEMIKQCLKKFNVHSNNHNNSKKQFVSTQKSLKTVGNQSSISKEKKVLTMSSNISNHTKQSSSKAKSIKDQIFEYFNLQNLKVKNPNEQSKLSLSNITKPFILTKSYENHHDGDIDKSIIGHKHDNGSKEKLNILIQPNNHNHKTNDNDNEYRSKKLVNKNLSTQNTLNQVYKEIQKVQDKIKQAQKENKYLKQKMTQQTIKQSNQIKKSKQITQHKQQQNKLHKKQEKKQRLSVQNYFSRPAILDNKKSNKDIPISQSTKKISYLQMSIDNKSLQQKDNHMKNKIINKKQKYSTKNISSFLNLNLNGNVNVNVNVNENQNQNGQNHVFDSIQLANKKRQKNMSQCKNYTHQNSKDSRNIYNDSKKENIDKKPSNNNVTRKCLVDISNLNISVGQDPKKGEIKSQFSSINNYMKSISSHKNNPAAFVTTTLAQSKTPHYTDQKTFNKNDFIDRTRQNMSSNKQSVQKFRSISVNQKHERNSHIFTDQKNSNNTSNIIQTLNSSFDTGAPKSQQVNQKKIAIPKLNLQVLPNYHGRSNKSLNQSFMQKYEKKVNGFNV